MKNLRTFSFTLTALAASCLAITAVHAADSYVVDPTHTSVVFSVSHTEMSYTYGFFRKAQGNYILDEANPSNSKFRFAIEANSLDTNNDDRDKHLRSADFFNVVQFPAITFESTSVQRADTPDGNIVYQVTGNLMMHGVTKSVTLPLRMLGKGQGLYKDQRSGFLTQIELKRSDYGMTNLLDKVGDAVGITISFEGSIPQSGTAPRAQ
jgi:polyisoprenoid-binding protein YceI